jgi:hypothetical protein
MARIMSTVPSTNMAAENGTTVRPWPRQVLAAAAAVVSLGATVLFVMETTAERGVSVASVQALVLDDAAKSLTPASDAAARSALWLDPLNQNALNLAYVHAFRRNEDPARLARFRMVLARLGWRSTPAQQNLLVAAAQRNDFAEVMDRVDGLLRRNKFAREIDPFIAAVESDPQTRAALVRKLRINPPWREMLLLRGGELRGSERLDDRAATMNAVLDGGAKLSRIEVSPFLTTAAASGELVSAHQLWSRTLRRPTEGGLLYDGGFKVAAEQGVRPPLPVPFEWTFGNGDGYTTQVGSDGGLFLRWSGRGIPVLLSQPIRVPADARGYQLHVETDRSSVPVIASKLALTLVCGKQVAEFRPVSRNATSLDLAAGPLACNMPMFTISGRLQDVAEPTTATLAKLHLKTR